MGGVARRPSPRRRDVSGSAGSAQTPNIRVPWAVVGIGCLAGLVALLGQQALVPMGAGDRMGLLTNGGDLDVYRHGALQVLHGRPLYAERLPPGGWFTYPPFAAVAFIPLALPSFAVAKAAWLLLSFAALAATIWRCATTLGWRADPRLAPFAVALALVAVDVQAVRGTLWQGQVNLLLMAIVVWDLTRPNDSRWRGWSVGLAAGVKLTAVVFIPYLVVTRQWRAATTATLTAALTVSVSWVALPADSAAYWLHAVGRTDRIGPLDHVGNYSLGGILANAAAPAAMPTGWWVAGVVGVGVLGLSAAHSAERTGRRLLAVTIVGLLSCVVPPLAWGHHWVWTVPLLAVLLDRAARTCGRVRVAWLAGAAAVYLLVFMWFTAWVYRAAATGLPTHAAAMGAAIGEMTRADRLVTVAIHPALFVAVALGTIASCRVWGLSTPLSRTRGGNPRSARGGG